MDRFYGAVGYITTVETRPGIYTPTTVERNYYGNVNRKNYRWESSNHMNDDTTMSMEIAIMADEYAYQHCSELKYVEYMGAKWKVNTITPDRPRLVLTIGGEYNGK